MNRSDDHHAPGVTVRALMDVERGHAQPEGLDRLGLGWGRCRRRLIECAARLRELQAFATISEQAVVADAHEAAR